MDKTLLPNNINQDDLKNIPFFFVIGRPRSGTTLLRTLLDAHPNIVIPFESPLILKLANKYSKIRIWNRELLNNLFDDLRVLKKFNTWLIDEELLKNNLLKINHELDYQTIIKFIYSHFNPIFVKEEIKIFGDKNPHYASSINKIFSLFPDAKYLHITRDYRDNILSNLKFEFGTSRKSLLAYRWKESIIKMNKLKEKYPNQFFTLRYEDLVEDPAQIMKSVCDILGVEYQPDILRFHEKKDEVLATFPLHSLERMLKFQSNLFRPINKSAVGKWKTDLEDRDVMIADMVVGDIAEKSGYERRFNSFGIIMYIQAYSLISLYRIQQAARYLFNKYLRF